jgi:hypothetical protein
MRVGEEGLGLSIVGRLAGETVGPVLGEPQQAGDRQQGSGDEEAFVPAALMGKHGMS